jgi:hypothetical protein
LGSAFSASAIQVANSAKGSMGWDMLSTAVTDGRRRAVKITESL